MRSSTSVAAGADVRPPLIRLRYVLLIGLLGLGAWYAVPRARAAWRVYSVATELADYALCMVGPTGPALLRDESARFWQLVRRRLTAAPARSAPFAACARAAGSLTGSEDTARAHRSEAWQFAEYGSGTREDRASRELHTLEDLRVDTRPLRRLAKAAGPFLRGGYTALVRASSHAPEAPHPTGPPEPAVGWGLPSWPSRYRAVASSEGDLVAVMGHGANLSAFRSTDSGIHWTAASLSEPTVSRLAGRCLSSPSSTWFEFGVSDDHRFKTVHSVRETGTRTTARLAGVQQSVFAAACDERALVAAVGKKGSRSVRIRMCPFEEACRELPLPEFEGTGQPVQYPLDVARLNGATIVAARMRGIVRVSSTRDDGQSWTPWTVVFDAAEHPAESPVQLPERLLALGDRLMLYGGGRSARDRYYVLFSDDLGASFRSP